MKEDMEKALQESDATMLGDELPYKLQVAAASLLVYAAKADGTFSENELETVMRALAREFQGSDWDTAELIEVASYLHDSKKRIEDFAGMLKQSLDEGQIRHVLTLVAKVIRSDGRASVAEKILMGNLVKVLGLKE